MNFKKKKIIKRLEESQDGMQKIIKEYYKYMKQLKSIVDRGNFENKWSL